MARKEVDLNKGSLDRVALIMESIKSVKARQQTALASGDLTAYSNLMYDLQALEVCLVEENEIYLSKAA